MSQKITVVGPNLPAQAKATFHVHAAGCADLKRGWIRRYDGLESFSFDADILEDVAEEVYADIIDENGDSPGDYLGEFHFAPCVTLKADGS